MCLIRILRWISTVITGLLVIVTVLAYTVMQFEDRKILLIGTIVNGVICIILTIIDEKLNG